MDLRIFKRDLYRVREMDTDAMNKIIQECKNDIKYYGDLLKKITSDPIFIKRLGTDCILGFKIQIKYRTVMMKIVEERLKKGVLKDDEMVDEDYIEDCIMEGKKYRFSQSLIKVRRKANGKKQTKRHFCQQR